MSDTYTDLLLALAGVPALPGARCRGRSHLFDEAPPGEDPEVTGYRHQHALTLCRGCTALASCTEWVGSLPKSKRPPGVVAGQVRESGSRAKESA
ncbi:MAG: hypothetical protein U0R81_16570 [Mycobacterium sp.]